MGYVPKQSDFYLIFAGFSGSFMGYVGLLKGKELSIKQLVLIAILLRILLIPSFPQLSNDIYRFLWDGLILDHGMSPYTHLPSEVLSMSLKGLDDTLFNLLNSPYYYSVYPPIAQSIYWLSSNVGMGDVYWTSVVMRVILILAEIGILYLFLHILPRLGISSKMAFWYALNPLIIIELVGNLHFEGLMIFFLLLNLKMILDQRYALAGLSFGLSIGTKLLPLIFLPFIWKYLKLNKTFLGTVFAVCMILFLPIVLTDLSHFVKSIDLYFGKFEFNASVYYLLRSLGYHISGYNLIRYLGPALGILTLAYCTWRFFKQEENDWSALAYSSLAAFSIYLFLATTIHPWYLSLVLFWNVFIGQRFILVWSFMIVLSYINYNNLEYHENLWIVSLEYALVIPIFIYENKMLFRENPRY